MLNEVNMNILSRCGSQFEVLQGLEPTVGALMARHKARPDMWFPSDLLPVNDCDDAREDDLRLLRRRARTLPDAVRVVLDMNIRTEEGLPHFHRLIAGVAKPGSNIGRWNYLWTAEEDRHGCVLRDYLRDASILDMRAVEVRQFEYLCAGFDPAWAGGSPYDLRLHDAPGKSDATFPSADGEGGGRLRADPRRHSPESRRG